MVVNNLITGADEIENVSNDITNVMLISFHQRLRKSAAAASSCANQLAG